MGDIYPFLAWNVQLLGLPQNTTATEPIESTRRDGQAATKIGDNSTIDP
jgi:hypothetical protein